MNVGTYLDDVAALGRSHRAKLGKAGPQRGIKARRRRRTNARARAVLVEKPREHIAHHFLFFGNVEIHLPGLPGAFMQPAN